MSDLKCPTCQCDNPAFFKKLQEPGLFQNFLLTMDITLYWCDTCSTMARKVEDGDLMAVDTGND